MCIRHRAGIPESPGRKARARRRVEPPLPPPEALQLRELDDGSAISGNDRPFTPAEADAVYENAIAHTPGREASVIENALTGERVVIQGDAARWAADPDVWQALLAAHGPGPWRGVRHFHMVEADGVTLPENRYPTGIGGDLASARGFSLRTRARQRESIDIVVRRRGKLVREQVRFGYDETQQPGRPWYVDVPLRDGGYAPREHFANLVEYHRWLETMTNERFPIQIGPDEPEPSR
jgi:hypothetical protein